MTPHPRTAIDRELAWVRLHAGAPRHARLGCSTVTHDRLDFCADCAAVNGPALELMAWRLLALRDRA